MVTTAEANDMLKHSLALAGQIGAASISRGAGMDRNKSEEKRNTEDHDAKLKELLTGKQMKQDAIDANAARADAEARAQGLKPGTYSSHISDDGYSYDPRDPKPPGYMLTPGQIEAERMGAKKVADYEAGGGRATSAKNIEQVQSVADDLDPKSASTTKRDLYDRKVGGLLNNFPSLMGAMAPTEKARRDKAYNAAMNLARQSDPNPTENQIRNIMGQIYDPSSDDKTNLERIQRFQQQQKGIDSDMSHSAENLARTGYVMPGLSGSGPSPSQPPVHRAQKEDKLRSFLGAKAAPQAQQGSGDMSGMSTEQLQQMLNSLKGGR